ncbi:MAG: hypothetical protein OXG25_10630 [Gammaproteobacteria bacterium]|nr:hypothetical protein [Gammaproteobacteria bacterium]
MLFSTTQSDVQASATEILFSDLIERAVEIRNNPCLEHRNIHSKEERIPINERPREIPV